MKGFSKEFQANLYNLLFSIVLLNNVKFSIQTLNGKDCAKVKNNKEFISLLSSYLSISDKECENFLCSFDNQNLSLESAKENKNCFIKFLYEIVIDLVCSHISIFINFKLGDRIGEMIFEQKSTFSNFHILSFANDSASDNFEKKEFSDLYSALNLFLYSKLQRMAESTEFPDNDKSDIEEIFNQREYGLFNLIKSKVISDQYLEKISDLWGKNRINFEKHNHLRTLNICYSNKKKFNSYNLQNLLEQNQFLISNNSTKILSKLISISISSLEISVSQFAPEFHTKQWITEFSCLDYLNSSFLKEYLIKEQISTLEKEIEELSSAFNNILNGLLGSSDRDKLKQINSEIIRLKSFLPSKDFNKSIIHHFLYNVKQLKKQFSNSINLFNYNLNFSFENFNRFDNELAISEIRKFQLPMLANSMNFRSIKVSEKEINLMNIFEKKRNSKRSSPYFQSPHSNTEKKIIFDTNFVKISSLLLNSPLNKMQNPYFVLFDNAIELRYSFIKEYYCSKLHSESYKEEMIKNLKRKIILFKLKSIVQAIVFANVFRKLHHFKTKFYKSYNSLKKIVINEAFRAIQSSKIVNILNEVNDPLPILPINSEEVKKNTTGESDKLRNLLVLHRFSLRISFINHIFKGSQRIQDFFRKQKQSQIEDFFIKLAMTFIEKKSHQIDCINKLSTAYRTYKFKKSWKSLKNTMKLRRFFLFKIKKYKELVLNEIKERKSIVKGF